MILPIVTHPNPILTTKTNAISLDVLKTEEVQTLIDNMIPTMYHAKGVGLAAPQIGQSKRICIIGKEAREPHAEDLVLVNPVWTKLSKKKTGDIEGCLSIPHIYGTVKRYDQILVNAQTRDGENIEFEAHGFFARVIQHEVDHLDGVLFIDKARDIFKKTD